MILLALDTATKTGAAWGPIGDAPTWEAFTAKGAGLGEKLSRFRYWLGAKIDAVKPDRIIYESRYLPVARAPRIVRAGSAAAAAPSGGPPINIATLKLLLALDGMVEEIAFDRRIDLREATTGEFIGYFTGKTRHGGRAAKKAATIAACARMGWVTASDDVADALALWAYAEFIMAPEVSARRMAGAGRELALFGTIEQPHQDRIGRRA